MTAWEVLDDAVKIGIGAIIGLVGARFAHTREWRTQRKARRIDTLESIAKDFEIVLNSSFGEQPLVIREQQPCLRGGIRRVNQSGGMGIAQR